MYDHLAPHYREYSETKAPYLDSIDRIVIQNIPDGAKSLLDVGAGDGIRGVGIANSRNIPKIVLSEPSKEMAALCRKLPVSEVWELTAEKLPEAEQPFDVIICLWNVLGHMPDQATRLLSLQRIGCMLSKDGTIFLDVNNRYNARSYGILPTLERVIYDVLHPSETNGDVSFNWHIGGKNIPSMGHLFTPGEVAGLIRDAGLKIKRRHMVDYRTGQERRFSLEGQMLFEVVRREES